MSRSSEGHDLLLIGGLPPSWRDRVRAFALESGAPVYAEPLSGLREDEALRDQRILNERSLARGGFRRVIRIGNVPTLRFWRDLDEGQRDIEVVSVSELPFRGLPRGEMLSAFPAVARRERDAEFFRRDRELHARFEEILDEEPESELALVRRISRELPRNARVYLGNSLPIREWDLAATREPKGFEIGANRGANGIDGQLSTFFGWCAPGAANVAIVGDLTTLYDLNAPWVVPQLDAQFRIVVINNRGGRIFERVASLRGLDRRLIDNPHALHFDAWSEMFGIDVEELRPDPGASRRVWQRYDELWS
jgi:2-succinyl-5-enolpyruvyl-6-hydroxy-3-cyclohexene-1-carboxylate synthase